MNTLDFKLLDNYIDSSMVAFNERRHKMLVGLDPAAIFRKNPYLLRQKNLFTANEIVSGLLEAFLSSSEEKLFGDFLEDLAIYIASLTCNGHKSTAPGVDLEFFNKETHYIVSVKSGPNWGNSSQQRKLEEDLRDAAGRLRQSRHSSNIQPVLGICYGKSRTRFLRGYMKVVGQNFWYLISENENLYLEIIEPIGYRAREHNDAFLQEKGRLINRCTKSFIDGFCDQKGTIDWVKLVEFNSKNLDLQG